MINGLKLFMAAAWYEFLLICAVVRLFFEV